MLRDFTYDELRRARDVLNQRLVLLDRPFRDVFRAPDPVERTGVVIEIGRIDDELRRRA